LQRKLKKLTVYSDTGLAVKMSDCGQSHDMFAWTAKVATSLSQAKSVLAQLRKTIKDAYLKPCHMRSDSLLDHHLSVVGSSITDVPEDAVNWSDEDGVSGIHAIGQELDILITRYFIDDPDDPLEGRREEVMLIDPSGEQYKYTLEPYCVNPGGFVENAGQSAFVRATE
jgi:hypothetical protein